ncbi:hypothetical protein PCE1_003466 [Barthelona sp. PCE]
MKLTVIFFLLFTTAFIRTNGYFQPPRCPVGKYGAHNFYVFNDGPPLFEYKGNVITKQKVKIVLVKTSYEYSSFHLGLKFAGYGVSFDSEKGSIWESHNEDTVEIGEIRTDAKIVIRQAMCLDCGYSMAIGREALDDIFTFLKPGKDLISQMKDVARYHDKFFY